MSLIEILIRKPVLSSVISLVLILLGTFSYFKLEIRQYPKTTNTVVTVSTSYPGASASDIKSYITSPITNAVAQADGIDYISSSSEESISSVVANIKLNYNSVKAFTDINAKVQSVVSALPRNSESPIVTKSTGIDFPSIMLSLYSEQHSTSELTNYLERVLKPELFTIPGISSVAGLGGASNAMRIWLDTKHMAAIGVTMDEVLHALQANNYQSAPGRLESQYQYINIKLLSDITHPKTFKNIPIKQQDGRIVRIGDIAHTEMGAASHDSSLKYDGKPAVVVAITQHESANILTVNKILMKLLPTIQAHLPSGIKLNPAYTTATFIQASLDNVLTTFMIAIVIIVSVIYLFLGSLKATLIPCLAIPISLIGTGFFMLMMGYSINLLTLLAMLLAIGLVVDDAIIVLENVYRHISDGKTPFHAAAMGSQEIGSAVVVMTTTLVAVFAPIGMTGGLTGALFSEFAFTLVSCVILSGVVALTFSPMLCSRILTPTTLSGWYATKASAYLTRVEAHYHNILSGLLESRLPIILLALFITLSTYLFYHGAQSELAPQEDQGFLYVMANAPPSTTLDYLEKYGSPIAPIISKYPEIAHNFTVFGYPSGNAIFSVPVFKLWKDRNITTIKASGMIQQQLRKIPGLQTMSIIPSSLPGSTSGALSYILKSSRDHRYLYNATQKFIQRVKDSGLFFYVNSSLKYNNPTLVIHIDRNAAAKLGVETSSIATAINGAISSGHLNYFSYLDKSLKVIPQAPRSQRDSIKSLKQISLDTDTGQSIPLSSLTHYEFTAQPESLTQFQQLNNTTLSLVPKPGITDGQVLDYLARTAKETLPSDIGTDTSGNLRQYIQEGGHLEQAFVLAILLIYLLLAAQFESFRDPFIILTSVPLSMFGALLPMYLAPGLSLLLPKFSAATLNIYSQIGLITLIGLITKAGILIVTFANQLQENEGLSVNQAVIKAASLRLKPILMTTASMVLGCIPLTLILGAGSASLFSIGIVIVFGLTIGTGFTLFVLPVIYSYLAQDRIAHQKAVDAFQK